MVKSDAEGFPEVEIRFVESWPEEDIVALYKAGGWWKSHYRSEGLDRMIAASYAFAVAVERASGRAVGMGRLISDGVSDAYLQDLVVLKEYRGRSVGKRLVKTLIRRCNDNDLVWIGTIAEAGTKGFYEPFGFKEFDGAPMVLEREEGDVETG